MSDALIQLIGEKDFSKITVNEIARLAGVNRSTWFRNFTDKSEALTYKLVTLWSRWTHDHGISDHNYTVDNAPDFFCFNYEHKELIVIMMNAGQHTAIYEAFYQIMKPQFETDVTECYQSRFLSHGLFGLLGEWCKRDFRDTPEEMSAVFFDIIRQSSYNEQAH